MLSTKMCLQILDLIYMYKEDLALNDTNLNQMMQIKQTICNIRQLHLCRGVIPPNYCPRYATKRSDGEVPVILELWGMRSTPSLLLLQGPHWAGMVAPDTALSMG